MKRRLTRLIPFLLLGVATTCAIAWSLVLVDVTTGPLRQASAYVDGGFWNVQRWDRAGAAQIISIRGNGDNVNWSPQQALGPPDTPTVGDQHSAWASLASDGGPEWLILEYAQAVIPRRVDVYESYSPGALSRVTIFDDQGNEIEAWKGTDPSASLGSSPTTPVSAIPVTLNVRTKKVKLYLDSDKVPGWNEIDAVGLFSDAGQIQWARHVTASSSYASNYGGAQAGSGDPLLLAPAWTGLDRPSRALDDGMLSREERHVDARGWPMLALKSEVVVANPTTAASGYSGGPGLSSGYGGGPVSGSMPALASGLGGPPGMSSTLIAVPSAVSTPNGQSVPAPFRPIWSGLLIDTLLYGTAWFALWAVAVIPRRFFREVARMRRGECIACGYDLGYDFVDGCPECGWRRQGRTAPSRLSMSSRIHGE